MTGIDDMGEPRPRVQRHRRDPLAGEQRRRLQLGTGYPHRGPAKAYTDRQRTYQPAPSGEQRAGRLRVLHRRAERDRAVERP